MRATPFTLAALLACLTAAPFADAVMLEGYRRAIIDPDNILTSIRIMRFYISLRLLRCEIDDWYHSAGTL